MRNHLSFPKRISITTALMINIAMLAVIVGVICVWLITYFASQEIRGEERKRLVLTAGSIALQISQHMAERYADVSLTRDLLEHQMAKATPKQKRSVLERVQTGHNYYSWLGIADKNGKIHIGTGGLLEGKSVAGRNWFEGALRKPVFFGNLHSATLLEHYMRNPDGAPLYLLDIAMPLHGVNGQVNGVLGSHFNWRMFEDITQQTLLDLSEGKTKISAAIIDENGAILYDTQNATGNVNALLTPASSGRMFENEWLDNKGSFFLLSSPVPSSGLFNGLGWKIVVREPTAAFEASISHMKWQVMGAALLTGLVFSLFGLFLVRPVTRPLALLIDDINDFGKTEVMPPPDGHHSIKEINNLHSAFLGMATHVVENKEKLRETQVEIVRALGRAGEFRDNETGNHVFRMSFCSERLAALAGWDVQAAGMLKLASQMHDVGKIGIPDHVLLKPGRFDEEERAIMERHSEIGAKILSGLDTPLTLMARRIALSHHEKWDGSGYPHRTAGADIPVEARIAAICDVFDALLSSRPYKQGWPLEKVENFLREETGRHFDPELVALFLDNLSDFVAIRERFSD